MSRLFLLCAALVACRDKGGAPDTGAGDTREACAHASDSRLLLWGDLHVHTARSFDAWVYDLRLGPDDAYRFARGEAVRLPPLGADGEGTTELRLARPLDFAAVTDHSEYLGEIAACTTPGGAVYDDEVCVDYRAANEASIQYFGVALTPEDPERNDAICGPEDCEGLAGGVWSEIRDAAEAHYDRSADCGFTTFVGYEWTGATNISNFHRNVIFRGRAAPALPVSYFEEPTAPGLWDALDAGCEAAGCDWLAIPHNANMSNGQLFHVEYPFESSEPEAAARRLEAEPVVEIFQHKGDSECTNGLEGVLAEADPLCDFEKLRREDPLDDCGEEPGAGAMAGLGCVSQLDFLRGQLLEGLRELARIGVTPYQLGVIAGTDTHSATPGAADEEGWPGHLGALEGTAEGRLAYPGLNPGGVINNPGGLTAAWATSNDRDAIFDALRRREVYGTSGRRIGLRVFGGRSWPEGWCDEADPAAAGYAAGVPMGGQLPAGEGAPQIAAWAWKDAGTAEAPGAPLQRLQVIKGWLDADGQRAVAVYDVAGGDDGASVDPETCEATHAGADQLCAVWTDPDYDPSEPAWYYARAVEDPVCRWSTRDCNSLPEADRPESCTDPSIQQIIQERAWSSPIWN